MNDLSSLRYLSLALLAALIFLALASSKFAFSIFRRDQPTIDRSPVPWGLEIGFATLIFFAVLSPAICTWVFQHIPNRSIVSAPTRQIAVIESIDSSNDTNEGAQNAIEATSSTDAQTTKITEQDNTSEKAADERAKKISQQHPMARLLILSESTPAFYIILALFFITAVCVAPVCEEFVFRVVLQGAFERAALKNTNAKARVAVAIIIPAIIFALLHAGIEGDPTQNEPIEFLLSCAFAQLVANGMTIMAGLAFLIKFFKPTQAQLGTGTIFNESNQTSGQRCKSFALEFWRGASLFVFAAPFVYGLHAVTQRATSANYSTPIAIFLFALILGSLYHKTRSWATVVGMHAALNFSSFLILCYEIGSKEF